MLASSSKRAMSSTTTVTSLPARAASMSVCMITESVPVRYTVCLIATTCGSLAASRMKSITGAKDWNGRCSRMSCLRRVSKRSLDFASALGSPGWKARNLRSGRSTWSGTLMSRTRFTGPFTR